MSGGFFGDYCYFQVSQFARDLEEEIKNNSMKDDCGYYTGYSKKTIEYLKEQVHYIHKIADIMYHIDRLYSGDHGEDSFMERVKEVEDKYGSW
jgi:regulator of sirC expression with transglutaminase-like and TPR domain